MRRISPRSNRVVSSTRVMDDFIARAEAEVARLREEDDHLAATEQGIQSRRAELAKQVVAGAKPLTTTGT